jgi:hypothetical protein
MEGQTGRGELYFSRPETTARISFVFPAVETGGAAKLLLDNPLDSQIGYSDEGFVGQLSRTHEHIASRHDAAYVDPVADPSVLARMYVPVDYDQDTLVASLQALDDIAVESECLHSELQTTLSRYGEDGPSARQGDRWPTGDPPDEPGTGFPADSEWTYVGSARVAPATGTIRLPDGLFEAGILERGGTTNWAYKKVSGVLVVSNQQLNGDEYRNVDTRRISDDGKCRIPQAFFPPDHEARPQMVAESVHEKAFVREGERRHFVYRTGMDEGDLRSCHLLTDEELTSALP